MKALAAVLLLLLVAPATSAAGGSLRAVEVHLVEGEAVQGRPTLVVREAATAVTSEFRLHADNLRIETDERAVQLFAVGTEPRTRVEHHRDVRMEGAAMQAGARLFVVPADGSRAELGGPGCSRVVPPSVTNRVHEPRVDGRPIIDVSLSATVAWTPCTNATVTLHGDMLLVLWSWDAHLTSDQGTSMLQSGQGAPAEGDPAAREQFLFARNATLTLPPARQTVYVEGLTASTGVARLSSAAGWMDGARVDGDLSLSGDVEVLVRGRGVGQPMSVAVGGTVDEALLDSVALVAPADGSWRWWPYLLAGLGVVGIVRVRPHLHYLHAERTGGELGSLIPQTLRQRRAVGLWIMARGAEGRRWFRSCRRRANKANDLFRPFPEAQFTRAVAAAALGRHADAMTDFIDLFHRYDEPMGRAAAACGMAQQCVRLGKLGGGQEWLRMAAKASFEYAHQASLSMDFDAYVGEPWFDALRRGVAWSSPSGPSGWRPDPSIQ